MFRVTDSKAHLHASLAAAHQLGRQALLAGADDQGGQSPAAPGALIGGEPLLLAHWSDLAVQALTEQLARAGGDHREARRRAAAALAKLCPAPRTTGTVGGDVALAGWSPKPVCDRGPSRPLSERWMEFAADIDYFDEDGGAHCDDPNWRCHESVEGLL